jgi:8-oxo-dGTP pyrophosphatase MutT (NUDIX family)
MSKHALHQLSSKLVLIDDQDRLLCLQGPVGRLRPELYDLPGGRVHVDETDVALIDVLQREIGEELGEQMRYTVDPGIVGIGRSFLLNLPDTLCVFALFAGRYDGGEIALSHEHSGVVWIPCAELRPAEMFLGGIADAVQMWLDRDPR